MRSPGLISLTWDLAIWRLRVCRGGLHSAVCLHLPDDFPWKVLGLVFRRPTPRASADLPPQQARSTAMNECYVVLHDTTELTLAAADASNSSLSLTWQ
jgi:hypothetical protein